MISLDRSICKQGPSPPHPIDMCLQLSVCIWRSDHSWHLSVPVETLMLRHIVSLVVWLQGFWQIDRASHSLSHLNNTLALIVVVTPSDFCVKGIDIDSARVAALLLPSPTIQAVSLAIVHIQPNHASSNTGCLTTSVYGRTVMALPIISLNR